MRTEPFERPGSNPALMVHLLGTPRIEFNGQLVHLERHKSLGLLAYLVVTQRMHSREWLATLLWPDSSTSRTQLRNVLAELRQKLGDHWLRSTRGEIGIQADALWSDVGNLLRVSAAFARGEVTPVLDVEALLALYPHHLLTGFSLRDALGFDEWQRIEEQSLRSRYENLLDFATGYYVQQQDYRAALALVHHWVTTNPYNEHARRQLIRLYAWTSQRALALREYQQLRNDIWENDRAQPEAETILLFQQLQAEANVPASSPRRLSTLPYVLPLIGRTAELGILLNMVHEGARLITITGYGGVGKTHLALAAAQQLETSFADGCCLIYSEDDATEQSLIIALLRAITVIAVQERDPLETLLVALRDRHLLIVLDSIHHVAHGQTVIQLILQHAPRVVILATSYHALEMNIEHCFALQGLPLDDLTTGGETEQGAVQLFIQGAKRVEPLFHQTPENLAVVRRICRLVEGMPLGILLASAWCAVLTPQEIADEIAQNFDFLHVNHRDVPERHQSLRAVFESAWRWLTAAEQSALMRLSIFGESFTRKAAGEISGVSLSALRALTSRALITFVPSRQRYVLHDVSRHYAVKKLIESRGRADLDERFGEFFARYLTDRHAALKGHLKEAAWREIEAELTHIRAAWRGALARKNFVLVEQMMIPLHLFFQSRGWEQGIMLFDEARRVAAVHPEACALYHKLVVRFHTLDQWSDEFNAALQYAIDHGDNDEVAHVHGEIGWHFLNERKFDRAQQHFAQAEAYYRTRQDWFATAMILRGLAYTAIESGEHRVAQHYADKSFRLWRMIGDHEGEHESLILRAELALLLGELDKAGEYYMEAHGYFGTHYLEDLSSIRTYSMGWWYLFSNRLNEALELSDRLLNLRTISGAELFICTAHAIKTAVYALQSEMNAAQLELAQLTALLGDLAIWPSTANPDTRFLVDFSRLLASAAIGQREQACEVLIDLRDAGWLSHDLYCTWIVPALLMLSRESSEVAHVEELSSLYGVSFLVTSPWVRSWTPFQQRVIRSSFSPAESGSMKQVVNTAISALLPIT